MQADLMRCKSSAD